MTSIRRVLAGLRDLWLVVGVTLLLLVVAEGLARMQAVREPVPDARIHADAYPDAPWVAELYDENARSARMRWESYSYWRRVPFAGAHINVDERGMRRTWQPPPAPDGTPPLRVFVFGGSTVWGTGVRDVHTIPSELAHYLADAGIPAEVGNYGESGYVSTQDLLALLRELQQGNVPDVAVFYLGANDAFSAFQNGSAGLPQNEEHRAREFNLLRHARRLVVETLRAAAERSALVRLSGVAVPAPALVDAPRSPTLVDDVLRALDANRAAIAGLAARYGFTASYFWEPCLLTKPHRTAYEESRVGDLPSSRDTILATYERVRRDWSASGQEDLTYLGDLFADTAQPRFLDRAHTGEVANREIAAAIGRRLTDAGRLRRRAGQ